MKEEDEYLGPQSDSDHGPQTDSDRGPQTDSDFGPQTDSEKEDRDEVKPSTSAAASKR